MNEGVEWCTDCKKIVDVESIKWGVSICSEAICAECPGLTEYIEQFEINCVRSDVDITTVSLSEARATGKSYVALKKQLNQLSFSGYDWHHLCAAISSKVTAIVSVDEDFFDPANKANPRARKKSDKVKRLIESNTEILIIKPNLCPCPAD